MAENVNEETEKKTYTTDGHVWETTTQFINEATAHATHQLNLKVNTAKGVFATCGGDDTRGWYGTAYTRKYIYHVYGVDGTFDYQFKWKGEAEAEGTQHEVTGTTNHFLITSAPSGAYSCPLSNIDVVGQGAQSEWRLLVSTDIDIPVFDENDTESIDKYKTTGDDSGAINYADLHGVKVDFYLANNGDRISFKYAPKQGADVENAEMLKIESYRLTFHSDIPLISSSDILINVTENAYNTTWESIINKYYEAYPGLAITSKILIDSIRTFEVTIEILYLNEVVSTLSAKITRKLLGLLGSVSATPIVSESNGYNLYCSTDNSFDNIATPAEDSSDATDNPSDGSTFGGFSNMLTTYKISKQALADLGNFIWSNSIFDDIKLLNNSPLENIVSCMYMPCDITGTNASIVVGNVKVNVSGDKLPQNMIKVKIAEFVMPISNTGFLAYEPYTSVALYLPFIGMIDLQPKDVCGYTVTVEYLFDVVVGSFGVLVFTSKGGGKTLIYSGNGVCSVNIPLTASNQAQVQASLLTGGISLVSDAISGNVMGAISDVTNIATIQNHSQTFGSPSSMVGAMSPNHCYYIIRTPIIKLPANFAHTKGFICMDTYSLSNLKGFTKLTTDVDLSGFNLTHNELERLRTILTSGFYL